MSLVTNMSSKRLKDCPKCGRAMLTAQGGCFCIDCRNKFPFKALWYEIKLWYLSINYDSSL